MFRTKAIAVVKNLTALTQVASKGELTSLEELIQEFVRTGDIGQNVIKVLWEKFAMKIPATTSDESRAALVVLGMAAG
jgi:condensin complex subunit 1